MLGLVILTSFLGQVLLNRAFQISNAAKASSINCAQVCTCQRTTIHQCERQPRVERRVLASLLQICMLPGPSVQILTVTKFTQY